MADTSSCALHSALGNFAGEAPLRAGAEALLNALGYNSQRKEEVGSVQEFLERFAPEDRLTEKQHSLFNQWNAVEIVFQFTADEIVSHPSLFEDPGFDYGRIESFLFVAVDMVDDNYSRTRLAEMTRAVNCLFAMPVILLFRYGSILTLATIHRRAHKHDDSRDVLDKVTLIKDIRLTDPHRAHIKILSDLEFSRMVESNVRSFDEMQAEWERTLDIETLNKRFYRELFSWFERAVDECHFPDDGAGEGSTERHVIRLVTRLLFIWFLKEKNLVSETLFEEQFAHSTLMNHAPDRTDYYCAVLQNLFFATLNTEIDRRLFATKGKLSRPDFNQYRYRDLLTNPDAFAKRLKEVPFVNGGLFDCLDDFAATGANGKLVDVFTDDSIQAEILCVPARLFFDEKGLFALFRHYKFTVEENTPLDREVALDPELLGRVFENLLAAYNPETRSTARKATGSYYTPRPVVDYMVREALGEALSVNVEPTDRDSEWWRERIDYLLDHASEKADAGDFFEADEKREIVSAIAHLKVLDPAVGSGAFPMGILQTLTLALRRLDPDNVLWEEIQKERAKARAEEAFDTREQSSRDETLLEVSATFQKYRKSDFGRKLYLIQNGIYGVDIQPIACQIAKLRFFISLIIEQDSSPDEFNLGIKPLPNLETRFVAADTLIRLERPVQMEIGQTEVVQNLERELAANREQYFHAGDRKEKLRLQEEDLRLRAGLADELKRAGFAATAASNIAHWDPFDQNTASNWFEPEYMFGESNGFDVVIGNPPYIQLQKNGGHAGNLYRNAGYETFAGMGDIYQLFYERGCELLKPAVGMLAYITSNSWLKAEYGRNLRQYFANQHTPLVLIEMGKNVFENAIVDTAVLIVRNGKDWPVTCLAVDVEQASDNLFPPSKGGWGVLQPKGDRPWMTLSSVERAVMEKMEVVGTPLREWDISMYLARLDVLCSTYFQ